MKKERLIVIKVGGAVVEDDAQLTRLLNDFAAIEGRKMLVHGGGRRATAVASRLGIETQMVGGRRITDAQTIDVVTMVYGGLVNKTIVARLQAIGINAIGLTGADMDCIRSHRRPPVVVRQESHHPSPLLPRGGDSQVGAFPGGGDTHRTPVPSFAKEGLGVVALSEPTTAARASEEKQGGDELHRAPVPSFGEPKVAVPTLVGGKAIEGLGVVAKTVEIDYGFVGDVDRVDASSLAHLIEQGATPVVAPLTHDGHGQMLNTNADTIASEVAKAMAAHGYEVTLVYCFEKAGVLANADDDASVIPLITRDSFGQLVADGTISGGMLPKIENALAATEAGVSRVLITHSTDLLGLHGTEIVKSEK